MRDSQAFSNNSIFADVDFTENHTEEGDEETRKRRGMKKREKQEFVSRRQHIMYEVQKRDHDKERKYHPVCYSSPFWSKFQLSSSHLYIPDPECWQAGSALLHRSLSSSAQTER